MGLNFRKSLSIGKLFRINFSKRGVGVSAGVKGARVSLNKDGVRETFSLPGTGLSWSERQSFRKRRKTGTSDAAAAAAGNKRRSAGQWKSLLWVAVVAGMFMLYKSGAFDPMIRSITTMLSGKPVAAVTASTKAEGDLSSTENASDVVAGSSNPAASPAASKDASTATNGPSATASGSPSTESGSSSGSAGIVQCKDGTVALKAGTVYVASKSGEKFHQLDCAVVASIASKNLVEYESRDAADGKKDPCTKCNP